MRKKYRIDIVANHYSEQPDIVRRFLDSIEMQDGIDFNDICVWVCSDGLDKKLDMSVLEGYKFPLRYAAVEHRGKCSIRNLLLDETANEYIMFCDVDDCFCEKDGLKIIFEAMQQREPNIIASDYLSETMRDGELKTVVYRKDIIRIHGKAYRRQYLKQKNIRYCDEVQVNADQYFMYQAFALTDNVVWIEKPFYCWKHNPKSCTKEEGGFNVRTYREMMTAYGLLAENFFSRGRMDLYDMVLCVTFAMMHVHSMFDPNFRENTDVAIRAQETIRDYLSRFLIHYLKIPEEVRKRQYIEEAKYLAVREPDKHYRNLLSWVGQMVATKEG